eukprot:5746325-Prymnesium_polylepis.1
MPTHAPSRHVSRTARCSLSARVAASSLWISSRQRRATLSSAAGRMRGERPPEGRRRTSLLIDAIALAGSSECAADEHCSLGASLNESDSEDLRFAVAPPTAPSTAGAPSSAGALPGRGGGVTRAKRSGTPRDPP